MKSDNYSGADGAFTAVDPAESTTENAAYRPFGSEDTEPQVTEVAAEGSSGSTACATSPVPEPAVAPVPGASPAHILKLVRQARQVHPRPRKSKASWAHRLCAITMLQRGVPIADVSEVHGVGPQDLEKFFDEARAKRRSIDFEGHIHLWATMLEQPSQEEKKAAEGVVLLDYISRYGQLHPQAEGTLEDAVSNFALVHMLVSNPELRKDYFDPPAGSSGGSLNLKLNATITSAKKSHG